MRTVPSPPSRLRSLTSIVCCGLLLAGCGITELEFTNDDRLDFVSPTERELVSPPVTIEWTMEDVALSGLDGPPGEDGAFVVFVDRAPMPVGRNLAWLAGEDASCARDGRCPDLEYLATLGVHVTTDTSVTLDRLPRAGGPDSRDEEHSVTVVLVDATGTRVGESAWYLPFLTPRRIS